MDVPSLLEAAMLICFGFSWPMNLIKNYRAASAKAMSFGFITLIITGYVAGIVAKIIILAQGGTVAWYVLTVYILNLIVVSMNMGVYFRNRALDRKAGK